MKTRHKVAWAIWMSWLSWWVYVGSHAAIRIAEHMRHVCDLCKLP